MPKPIYKTRGELELEGILSLPKNKGLLNDLLGFLLASGLRQWDGKAPLEVTQAAISRRVEELQIQLKKRRDPRKLLSDTWDFCSSRIADGVHEW